MNSIQSPTSTESKMKTREEIEEIIRNRRAERAGIVGQIIIWWNEDSWWSHTHNQGNYQENTPSEVIILNSKYSKVRDSIFYWDNVEVLYADAESFRTPFKNERYALDNNHVYISGTVILGADPKTFCFYQIKWEDSAYATDSTGRIYYKLEILNLDKETFQVVGRTHGFDQFWVYNIGRKLTGEDLKKAIEKYKIPLSATKLFFKNLLKIKK